MCNNLGPIIPVPQEAERGVLRECEDNLSYRMRLFQNPNIQWNKQKPNKFLQRTPTFRLKAHRYPFSVFLRCMHIFYSLGRHTNQILLIAGRAGQRKNIKKKKTNPNQC